jgi:flagellar biosynthetic protein FliO
MVEIGQMAAVAGVLTLLGLTLWFLRRRGIAGMLPARRAPARRLECLERLPLGPHHTLHLVRMGETSLLVASSPGGCSLVQSFPPDGGARRDGAASRMEAIQ